MIDAPRRRAALQPPNRRFHTSSRLTPRWNHEPGSRLIPRWTRLGFRPAFNAQLAVDTATLIITGVDLINSGSDMNQMLPMPEQHRDRYARLPAQWLDGGFARHEQI